MKLTLLVLFATISATFAAENEVYQSLMQQGVRSEQQQMMLPKPTLADGLDAAAQQKVLAEITDANHPLESLLRHSPVAPFVLKISGDDPSHPADTLRRVDLWFVAYSNLEKLSDETFLKDQVRAEAKDAPETDRGRVFTTDELKERGIDEPKSQRHLATRLTLFDRVRLTGVMQSQLTRTNDSVLLAAQVDQRFMKDRDFPNQWRSISRDDDGRSRVGEPHPYLAAAWYMKATKLHAAEGAVLMEYHVVFDEPTGWFNGANLLRSKLPLVTQDTVRKFRRRLDEAK